MFTGTYTAIVTPFKNGALHEAALEHLIKLQIKGGVDGIVPVGTTGESPTVDCEEHVRIIALAVKFASGKIKVLAGTGANATSEAIKLTQEAEKVGADGSLQVAPYYNKPTQEGLFQHYSAIAKGVELPIIVYNVPGRTSVNIEPATIARLAQVEWIAGVKEASGNISQMGAILNSVPETFIVLSGDDALTLPLGALGGRGIISVASNEIPAEMTHLAKLCNEGNFHAARKVHRQYLPLMDVNFIESSPGPVKAAMGMMGLLEPIWRLPMVAPKPESLAKIKSVLESCGLLGESAAQKGRANVA
jgi:4-hydroxy-tetrahydrodipicolinate synthase